jgi:hypothetical protein
MLVAVLGHTRAGSTNAATGGIAPIGTRVGRRRFLRLPPECSTSALVSVPSTQASVHRQYVSREAVIGLTLTARKQRLRHDPPSQPAITTGMDLLSRDDFIMYPVLRQQIEPEFAQ